PERRACPIARGRQSVRGMNAHRRISRRRTRHAQIVVLAIVSAIAATSCVSGGSSEPRRLSHTDVEVVAVWKGSEQRNFERVLDAFSQQTGATVRYVSSGNEDISAVLDRLLAAKRPPDVAVLPEPGL